MAYGYVGVIPVMSEREAKYYSERLGLPVTSAPVQAPTPQRIGETLGEYSKRAYSETQQQPTTYSFPVPMGGAGAPVKPEPTPVTLKPISLFDVTPSVSPVPSLYETGFSYRIMKTTGEQTAQTGYVLTPKPSQVEYYPLGSQWEALKAKPVIPPQAFTPPPLGIGERRTVYAGEMQIQEQRAQEKYEESLRGIAVLMPKELAPTPQTKRMEGMEAATFAAQETAKSLARGAVGFGLGVAALGVHLAHGKPAEAAKQVAAGYVSIVAIPAAVGLEIAAKGKVTPELSHSFGELVGGLTAGYGIIKGAQYAYGKLTAPKFEVKQLTAIKITEKGQYVEAQKLQYAYKIEPVYETIKTQQPPMYPLKTEGVYVKQTAQVVSQPIKTIQVSREAGIAQVKVGAESVTIARWVEAPATTLIKPMIGKAVLPSGTYRVIIPEGGEMVFKPIVRGEVSAPPITPKVLPSEVAYGAKTYVRFYPPLIAPKEGFGKLFAPKVLTAKSAGAVTVESAGLSASVASAFQTQAGIRGLPAPMQQMLSQTYVKQLQAPKFEGLLPAFQPQVVEKAAEKEKQIQKPFLMPKLVEKTAIRPAVAVVQPPIQEFRPKEAQRVIPSEEQIVLPRQVPKITPIQHIIPQEIDIPRQDVIQLPEQIQPPIEKQIEFQIPKQPPIPPRIKLPPLPPIVKIPKGGEMRMPLKRVGYEKRPAFPLVAGVRTLTPLADWLSKTQTELALRKPAHHPRITRGTLRSFERMLRTGGMRFPTAEMMRGKVKPPKQRPFKLNFGGGKALKMSFKLRL